MDSRRGREWSGSRSARHGFDMRYYAQGTYAQWCFCEILPLRFVEEENAMSRFHTTHVLISRQQLLPGRLVRPISYGDMVGQGGSELRQRALERKVWRASRGDDDRAK